VSNTGCASVGELEITRRISPVAVCCSSVSVRSRLRTSSSLNRRTFSDGDDGLVGEGLEQLDLPLREKAGLRAVDGDRADRESVAQHGHCEHAPKFGDLGDGRMLIFGIALDVGDVHEPALENGAAGAAAAIGRVRPHRLHHVDARGRQAIVSREVDPLAIVLEHEAELRFEEPLGAPRDGVEDGLDVGGASWR
jgi:hypothetical protein